jgi:hypothetical protein
VTGLRSIGRLKPTLSLDLAVRLVSAKLRGAT